MLKVLWFSLCPPYKEVRHAGGQALYKHVLSFLQDKDIHIKMISLCSKCEYEISKNLGNNYSAELIVENPTKHKFIDYESRWNPLHRFGGYLSNSRYLKLKRCIEDLKNQRYTPDIIILNWTEMLALQDKVKNAFPEAKIVAIEEDVAFVKRERRWKNSANKMVQFFHHIRYINCINKEKKWLNNVDLVAVYSDKDKERLMDIGIKNEKVFTFSPVFADKSDLDYKRKNNDILFWGAMARKENSDSAIWFIDNVMPLLEETECRFVIVGANPPKELLAKATERVIVTGFVDSPDIFFSESMCMVVPLIIGAGIKIKVLEGLSSGLPVISNNIGVEGIHVVDGKHYLHAETAHQFADAVLKVKDNAILSANISKQAKNLIAVEYNEEASTKEFIKRCKELKR